MHFMMHSYKNIIYKHFFLNTYMNFSSPSPPFEVYGLETFCLRSHLTRLELTPT